jgi:hypothetical protein
VIVGLGIDIVAHLNQQSQVIVRSKAGIDPEFDDQQLRIGAIVLLKPLQAML